MSTLVIGAVRSNSTSPPTFQNTNGTEVGQLCRAWVNFNGSTGAIRASFNISSVTRNGVGDYTINFANAFSDANYVLAGTGQTEFSLGIVTISASSVRFYHGRYGTGNSDPTYVCVSIFR